MELRTIVLSKKYQKPCQELFELFYKKFLYTCFITANRPEGADCGEWLPNFFNLTGDSLLVKFVYLYSTIATTSLMGDPIDFKMTDYDYEKSHNPKSYLSESPHVGIPDSRTVKTLPLLTLPLLIEERRIMHGGVYTRLHKPCT
jgi:hypothetical protein